MSLKLLRDVSETAKDPMMGLLSSISGLIKWSGTRKLAVFGLTVGGITLLLTSKFFRRKRKFLEPQKRSIRAARRVRQVSVKSASILASDCLDHQRKTIHNWAELQRQSRMGSFDQESVASVATLVDGTPLTPQQLGLMGMEALETVFGYWEDALAAYRPKNRKNDLVLTSPEEAEFIKSLENILEGAYQLQEEAEHLFIHEHSVLNRKKPSSTEPPTSDGNSIVIKSFVTSAAIRPKEVLSVSTVDGESFVSAQDTIADLKDFDDFGDILGDADLSQELYVEALTHLEKYGIPYRAIRYEFVGVGSETEYLGKLHCIRLAFKQIMSDETTRSWWIDSGRKILSELLIRSEKDPKDFITIYDDLMEYLSIEENLVIMAEELESRNVKCTNFYDIVLDYIIIDSFEDLEAPHASVLAVMKNRWLSNGFKESALQTTVWSLLKAKRRMLRYQNGFKAQFYNLSEILTPILAWGFFGPDENLNSLMNYFKKATLGFIRDLYDFRHVRYTDVETMATDVMNLASKNFDSIVQYMDEKL